MAREAFVSSLSTGLLVSAAASLVGAALAWKLIAPRIDRPAPTAPVPEAAARLPESEDAPTEVSLV